MFKTKREAQYLFLNVHFCSVRQIAVYTFKTILPTRNVTEPTQIIAETLKFNGALFFRTLLNPITRFLLNQYCKFRYYLYFCV